MSGLAYKKDALAIKADKMIRVSKTCENVLLFLKDSVIIVKDD